jgi:heme-degrading monooxygenase HmoA
MVFRTWTAVAGSPADARAYAEHLRSTVFPQLQQIDGHEGAYLLQSPDADGIRVLVITAWRSMDAVRRFAGDDPEVAVVEPAARGVLRQFDTRVRHYEVVIDTTARSSASGENDEQ